MKNIKSIFSPKSVAIVGASTKPLSVGYEMLQCVLNYKFSGPVFPVNPSADSIMGIKAYPSILDIPHDVELAVIVVKRDFVLPSMEQCAEKGVKAVIVITAGFKEVSEEGAILEEKVSQIARDNGIAMIGPNCMGAFDTNPEVHFNATFTRKLPTRGNVGLISQSGAMGAAVTDYALERHIGFSKFISIGNKPVINENHCLEALENDEDTDVILLYLENFADAKEFSKICKRITPKKPVIVLKSGRSATGAKAASSHTGALAGSDTAVDALLDECGCLRADSIEDMLILSHTFSKRHDVKGKRLGLVTNAGGPGIITTDELERAGFEIAELHPDTIKKLEAQLPAEASSSNPCDVLPGTGAEGYRIGTQELSQDPNLDAVIVLFLCPVMVKPKWLVDAILPVVKDSPIPVIGLFMGASDVVREGAPLAEVGMPILTGAPEVARALKACNDYEKIKNRKELAPANFDVDKTRADKLVKKTGEGWMESDDAFGLLDAYGIPTVKSLSVPISEDVVAAAEALNYPLVMKIISPDILHKSDAGGVIVGIKDAEDLKNRSQEMLKHLKATLPEASLEGLLLQELITYETQLIIGVNREEGFGPLVMAGMGGIFVEILKDVRFALSPMPANKPEEMLRSLNSVAIFEGARGTEGIDIPQVAEVINRISQLAADYPEIEQLDINPLLAGAKGCCAVDCRIKLSK